ncbi:MAG: thiamine pyrophosphate-binding protein, partial [Pseudomonadota bacterium]
MIRVADVIVDSVLAQGATIGFGVPGESYLAVLDAFFDRRDRFRFVPTRHEGGAAFMAEAFGKLTGRPGLCFVTRGPGATNAAIGIHTAMQNSTPMVLFVGQIRSGDRDREAFQELDYRQVFGPIAKWVTEIDNPDRAAELVRRAYTTAMTGRPGPVVVALPENVLRMETPVPAASSVVLPKLSAHPEDLSAAREAYLLADRPLVVVGGGGWTEVDRQALNAWARGTKTPVIAGFRYQDLVDNRLATYVGDAGVGMPAGSRAALQEADLIIAVNVRFGEMMTDAWSLFEGRDRMPKIIHLHRDPAEINKVYSASVALLGAPADLFEVLGDHPTDANWAAHHRETNVGLRAGDANANVSMHALCRALNAALPDSAILTNGAGNFAAWPSRHIDLGAGRRLIAPQSGAMGAGIPAAIAAKLISPERHVLCFAGDGDAQMTGQEMATATQEGALPNILVLDNGG